MHFTADTKVTSLDDARRIISGLNKIDKISSWTIRGPNDNFNFDEEKALECVSKKPEVYLKSIRQTLER